MRRVGERSRESRAWKRAVGGKRPWGGLAVGLVLLIVACHPNRLKVPKAVQQPTEPVPTVVRLPQTHQELAARLDVREPLLRPGAGTAAFGWRMDPAGSADGGFRWRHQRVESFRRDLQAASPQQRKSMLLLAVASPDRTVGANAMIALAREGNRDALQRLLPIVHNAEAPTTVRCAALETASLTYGESMLKHVNQLIDTALQIPAAAEPPDSGLVAEALRNLAVYRSVEEEPRFGLALAHGESAIQLAALEAWETPGQIAPPTEITGLFASPEPKVRAAALRVLAMRPIAGSYEQLVLLMRDPNYKVQQAAAQAMLASQHPQAQVDLERYAKGGSELVRASIATAFAQYGYYDSAYAMADDKSWRVRQAVASAIETDDRDVALSLAEKLVEDRSPQVQAQAIQSVSQWPVQRSGQILLTAMNSKAFTTREAARIALSQDWPAAGVFSSAAPPQQRQQTLNHLARSFASKYHPNQPPGVAPRTTIDVDAAVKQIEKAEPSQRDEALHNLLSAIEQNDITARQGKAIAESLSKWGTATPWPSVIRALDGRDQGRTSILPPALAGESMPAAKAACRHLGQFPVTDTKSREQFSELLRRLSASGNPEVATEALHALAATGDRRQIEWLAKYLSAGERPLRIAAALGLVRLNDRRGAPALERLASEPNVRNRRELLRQLREAQDPRLAYLVVRLLNDRPDIARVALKTLNEWSASGVLPAVAAADSSFTDQRVAWQMYTRQSVTPGYGVSPTLGPPESESVVVPAGYDETQQR